MLYTYTRKTKSSPKISSTNRFGRHNWSPLIGIGYLTKYGWYKNERLIQKKTVTIHSSNTLCTAKFNGSFQFWICLFRSIRPPELYLFHRGRQ